MRVSRFARRFHDPWGNRQGNVRGTICKFQYLVGATQFSHDDEGVPVCARGVRVDRDKYSYSGSAARFVRGSKSLESLVR